MNQPVSAVFIFVLQSCLYAQLEWTKAQALKDGNATTSLQVQATEWYKNSASYWPFEDDVSSDNIAKDYTGRSDGRIGGDFHTVSGIVGSALALSGNDSWVDFGVVPSACLNSPSTCPSGFTIAFWLKIPEFQGNKIILQLGQHRYSRGFTVWTRKSQKNNVGFSVNTRRRKYHWIQNWSSDHWTHVALKWNNIASSLKIYFNCSVVKVIDKSENAYNGTDKASRLILGASHAMKKNMKLMVDEFAIWNRTLEDSTLCEVFNTRSVHGNYSNWSEFSACSFSCGNGTKQRTRNCTNPTPANRGKNCSSLGPPVQHKACFLKECPIDGNYSKWSEFSPCSKTCGNGTAQRTRNCSNPEPKFGGRNCSHLGLEVERKQCNTHPCAINGGFTPWSKFSNCDKSCGNGTRQRTRSCTDPSPKYGGRNCSHLGSDIEREPCNTHFCPIHGGFSQWTAFSECTKSCESGTKQRTRECSNPEPAHGGLNCSGLGSPVDIQQCNTHPCPINGNYTPWTNFSDCSKSCGNGTQQRTRKCTNPPPQFRGRNCSGLGSSVEIRQCNTHPCPINGNYTPWTNFSDCSKTCGNGTRHRTRKCTNPPPQFRGRNCSSLGSSVEIRQCNTHPCPINGNYTPWTNFSDCSKTCGNGTRHRTRKCTNPPPRFEGENCLHLGSAVQRQRCFLRPCPVHGGYSGWSGFSNCSRTCGVGIRNRTRECTNPVPKHGGKHCVGSAIRIQVCNTFPCPVHGDYSSWSNFSPCSKSCGIGAMRRTRNCSNPLPKHGGNNCSSLGVAKEVRNCNVFPCPIHGNYSSWSNFSVCSKSCGNGTRVRTRKCSNPSPKYAGNNCSSLGHPQEVRSCNVIPCPIHGNYSSWTNFSVCSKSCGNGTRKRTRTCSNPSPKHGGNNCSWLGLAKEIRSCNVFSCPIHGNHSSWSNFSSCSKTCGNGTMERTRNCSDPKPRHGGNNCSSLGPSKEVRSCNVFPCPIHGNYSSWSNFSICSKSCGNGTKVRTRTCSNPSPKHGGNNCSSLGRPQEVRSCNVFSCPIHGNYSSWSIFSSCSKTCGNGTMERTRNCSYPAPRHGGNNCSSLGTSKEVRNCNVFFCPIHGNYSSWSNFSNCSKTCANGTMERTRTCSNPTPKYSGSNCSLLGLPREVRSCNVFPCPVHGSFSSWSNFSVCSKICGNGTMERTRHCSNPKPKHGGRDCFLLGSAKETKSCNVFPCPVHGNYSVWSNFSFCSKSCGNGTMTRTRTCTHPSPLHNGRNCSSFGPPIENQPCNVFPCPIDGGYTEWGNFSHCTASCGGGTMQRTRHCSNPLPQHGGKNCSHLGPSIDERSCNEHPCPIDGGYTTWSAFEKCSETCGNNGTSQRTRNCSNPSPQFGGRNCSRLGPAVDTKQCFLTPCPIDGGYSEWTNFSQCTRSCNGGQKTRKRQCTHPIPQHGGRDCSRLGQDTEVQSCNTFPCPIHGGYGEWTQYQPCTVTCGGGLRIRRRNCTNPPPAHGGSDCSSLGPSMENFDCNTQYCPDIVFGVTVNLTSVAWNDKLSTNKRDPKTNLLILKIRFGVEKILGEETISEFQDFTFRKGSVIADFSVSLLHRYYQGITRLQDAIFMDGRLEDSLPVTAVRLSSIDVPDMAPTNITAANSSSTSIRLQWSPIPSNHSNGDILNYRLTFYEATRSAVLGNEASWQMILDGAKLTAQVTGLKKFTAYYLRIAGINHRGVGVDSFPVAVNTDEDKPSVSPSNVNTSSISSTAIQVLWTSIPQLFVHGVLLGYHIHYSNLDPEGYGDVDAGVHSTEGTNTSAVLRNRRKFTKYMIQVSGFTVKGEGPLSDAVFVRTDEDVPSRPPTKVTGNNLTSTSIEVRWNALHPRDVNGILLGYTISYIATDCGDRRQNWNETEVGRSTTSAVITNLRKFTKYMVSVEGFTAKGSGIHSKCVAITTDEDRPDAHPQNLTGFNKSSTELFVEWQHIPPQNRNGILLGYKVFYAPSKSYQAFSEKIVDSTMSSTTLQKLKKYTKYTIKVAGFTSKGLGPHSLAIERRTSEDVPSKPAISVKARNTSHTSIHVTWLDIPRDFVHGVLLGYRVLYRRSNESRDTYEMKVLDPERNAIELKDLWIYTKYSIQIIGFTNAGNGTVSREIVASTDEFTPSLPPVNVQAFNKTSPTEILVQWNPIPDHFYVHGILRGYKVLYKVIAIANDTVEEGMETNVVTVGPTVLSVELRQLSAFTRYEIEVLAFTVKGDGVKSRPIRAETCNCHSTLFTNWWLSPPYVDSEDSNKTGIITPILKRVIHACCENCTAHGSSRIDFELTATGRPAKKSGLVQFKRSFEENTELHYPVYGFMDQTRYSNNYGFVPFVQSPGLALIIIGDEEGTAAKLLISSLALCLPILFLSIVMLWVTSLALWFVETAYNERHFPHNVLQGSWEAMWWAFASMTTLGYGDRIPRTPFGRLLCLSWILMGLVMVTCFNSTMTTLLTARILNKDVTLYGTKIAAIQNSSEYRLAIRKNAKVNPGGKEYTNLQETYDALTNREVKGLLVDAYTVGSRKELFNRRDLRISKLLDYSSAYGVVLGGEGKKLQKCFQRYMGEQRSEISKVIEDNVEMIEVTPNSMTVERSKGLFDPQFPTYIRAMIVCGVILTVVWLVGAKFELAKRMGWIKFRRKAKADGPLVPRSVELIQNREELKTEMSRIVAIFKMNCEYRKNVLQQKHRKELLHLVKLKKQADNKMVKKPSFRKDSIFSFTLGARTFTPESNSLSDRNGHSRPHYDSSLKTSDEIETIV